MIAQYLRYGIANPMPEVKDIKPCDLSFSDMIKWLKIRVSKAMPKIDSNETIFQLSGGFDSSVVVSHYDHIDTFCTGEKDSLDQAYSNRVSKEFNTNHTWLAHNDLLDMIDFKEAIINMASINRHPRCFRNDFGLYAFLNYIKDFKSVVVSGKGIEFQFLGYYAIYNKILEHAIGSREYSVSKATSYLRNKKVESPQDLVDLNMKNVITSLKQRSQYQLNMVQWWTGTFSRGEVGRLTGEWKDDDIYFDTATQIINFLFEWFGREYVDNRLEDYGKYFGVQCITPYIDDDLVSFVKTIPIEAKKCMNQHKFIFYEAMAHKVPLYVTQRQKEGLNTSHKYFELYKNAIAELTTEYLHDSGSKIYKYIDYVELFWGEFTPDQWWVLLNLSIWMEHNASN